MFQSSGWKLDTKDIKLGGIPEKKSKTQKRKEKKERRREASQVSEPIHNENKVSLVNEPVHNDDETEVKDSNKENNEEKESEKNEKKKSKSKSKSSEAESKPLPVTTKLTPLQQKMMNKLSGSRFRWINEQLYTIKSEDALKLIQEQPVLFDEYHQGFRSQVQGWPENPVDVFFQQIKTKALRKNVNAPGGLPGLKDKQVVIADMGCGEAQLALDVNNFVATQSSKKYKGKKLNIKVHSFDLKKYNDRITVADIKNVPLPNESCSVVVFCLALMGTNFLDFIKEAYRLLIPRGELWIAEIKSRFSESEGKSNNDELVGKEFVDTLKMCGFFHKSTDNSNKMFTRFEFFKPPMDILKEREEKMNRKRKFIEDETDKEKLENKRKKTAEGNWLLKPCIYKRR